MMGNVQTAPSWCLQRDLHDSDPIHGEIPDAEPKFITVDALRPIDEIEPRLAKIRGEQHYSSSVVDTDGRRSDGPCSEQPVWNQIHAILPAAAKRGSLLGGGMIRSLRATIEDPRERQESDDATNYGETKFPVAFCAGRQVMDPQPRPLPSLLGIHSDSPPPRTTGTFRRSQSVVLEAWRARSANRNSLGWCAGMDQTKSRNKGAYLAE